MFDERELIAIVYRSTQAQCREIGEIFLELANSPRDLHWKAGFSRKLASFSAKSDDLASRVESARRRTVQDDDEQWRAGRDPIQMRRRLTELGYSGEEAGDPDEDELYAYRWGSRPDPSATGLDEQTIIALVAGMSQQHCREVGEIFLSFAETPRDEAWEANCRRAEEALPPAPEDERYRKRRAARMRVVAADAEDWRAGWHPIQMRRKLEAMG